MILAKPQRQFEKTFSPGLVSDENYTESSAGMHQRLIRQPDGRTILVIREPSGLVQRIPVLTFERGCIA